MEGGNNVPPGEGLERPAQPRRDRLLRKDREDKEIKYKALWSNGSARQPLELNVLVRIQVGQLIKYILLGGELDYHSSKRNGP